MTEYNAETYKRLPVGIANGEAILSKTREPGWYQWITQRRFFDRQADITTHAVRQMCDIVTKFSTLPRNGQHRFDRCPNTKVLEQIVNRFRYIVYT